MGIKYANKVIMALQPYCKCCKELDEENSDNPGTEPFLSRENIFVY